jgi:hypothetical protein
LGGGNSRAGKQKMKACIFRFTLKTEISASNAELEL